MRGGILLAVALGGLALTAWHLMPQPDVPPVVGRVDVLGVERLAPNAVRSTSGLEIGGTWTSRAERQAIDELTRLPQVRSVSIDVEPRPAHEDVLVRIEISERQPYGIVELKDGQRHWVDHDGIVLEPIDRQPPLLPVMLDVRQLPSPDGPRMASENGVRVMRSLYALRGDALQQIASMKVRGYDLILHMREGWRALLPPRGLSEQMARLERVVAALRAKGDPGWRTLDLRVPGEVVIGR